MSAAAANYVRQLRRGPSGEDITCTEKCVLWSLAERHNPDHVGAWPSIRNLADEARLSERATQTALASLEHKGVLQVVRRMTEGGRSTSNLYVFLDLETGDGMGAAGAPCTGRDRVQQVHPMGAA